MGEISFAAISAWTVAVADPQSLTRIMFYVNIGLILFTVMQMTGLIILNRKTSCASVIGFAAVLVLSMSVVLFLIQLLMYAFGVANAMYVVSFCLCITYAAYIMSCVYCIMLSKNSYKTFCIVTGVFDFIPPVGAVLTLILSCKVERDTTVQEYVYNGYAYTYAALGEYCAINKAAFTDLSGDEEPEKLTKKESKRKLKELKGQTGTPEGQYAYAAAIATYSPQYTKTALKFMKKAAQGNHPAALFNMGFYYELGAYVKKDLKKARDCYMRAADGGDEDAAVRLGILEIKNRNAEEGFAVFKSRAEEHKDRCALYNMAVCYELGLGVEPDINQALEIYCKCDADEKSKDRHAAEIAAIARKRIFAIAATDINSAQNGDFFRKVTDRPFKGVFRIMMDGLIEIKKRHAKDASDKFLKAVKKGGEWEGLARCLVGTLYLDNGKELNDKINGAEFIQSALEIMPEAKDMLKVVPPSILKKTKSRRNAENKNRNAKSANNSKKE